MYTTHGSIVLVLQWLPWVMEEAGEGHIFLSMYADLQWNCSCYGDFGKNPPTFHRSNFTYNVKFERFSMNIFGWKSAYFVPRAMEKRPYVENMWFHPCPTYNFVYQGIICEYLNFLFANHNFFKVWGRFVSHVVLWHV